jgi:Flp pilus assembly protein TadG
MTWWRRRAALLADAHSREGGYVAVFVAIIVASGLLFAMAAISVDTSRWYDERARVQKAADAAALAGVPYLPYDLANATIRAKEVAKRNGYDDASSDVVVTVETGDLASQLKVTITSRIDNTFGRIIGVDNANITMTATADYKGPAPMGSPCNTFGNEPNPGTNSSSPLPSGTAQGASPFSNCSRTPQLWATVEGPETGKLQGDRYQTKGCEGNGSGAPASGVDGCSGGGWGTNTEYDEFGYVFVVKVQPAAVGQTIALQLYDPIFATVGQRCENLPDSTAFANNTNATNPYTLNNDALNRYSDDGPSYASFCPGDSQAGNGSGQTPRHPPATSFVLRQQVDSLDPELAPVQNDTSGIPCIKQYQGLHLNGEVAAGTFKSGDAAYNAELVKYFHNWAPFCTFTPTRAGDYYLQVRTNVSLGGGSGYERSGNTAAAAATGNTTVGEGSNGFAIRAVTPTGYEKEVAVSGYNHMPIFVNANTAAPIFNLIRVLPGAAGQFISFSYFDAGDAAAAGTVQILPPTDATGSITSTPYPGSCKAVGGSAGSGQTLTACTAPFEQSGGYSKNNGKTETITIPIPTDYTCNYNSFGGCWYRVQINFGTGTVNDVTTWDATIIGDPVRLIK